MNRLYFSLFAYFLLILVSLFYSLYHASAQTPNDWPLFQKDPQHTGFNSAESTLKPPLTLLWSLALDDGPSGFGDRPHDVLPLIPGSRQTLASMAKPKLTKKELTKVYDYLFSGAF